MQIMQQEGKEEGGKRRNEEELEEGGRRNNLHKRGPWCEEGDEKELSDLAELAGEEGC